MSENPYKVLGPGAPAPLRGRQAALRAVMSHLAKSSPNHVSVVGPRYAGKTVLLWKVAQEHAAGLGSFHGSVYCDMRHWSLDSNASFFQELARPMHASLRRVAPDVAGLVTEEELGNPEKLVSALSLLADAKKCLLVVFDRIDVALQAPGITIGVWNKLRSLADLPSLRYVTGSRHELIDLCPPDSKTSDFFGIFPRSIQMLPLVEEDWSELVLPFKGRSVELEPGARKELVNWTGGVPLLASALLHALWDAPEVCDGARVNNEVVNAVARALLVQEPQLLQAIWDDCSPEEQATFADIASDRVPSVMAPPKDRIASLVARGLVEKDDGSWRTCCRLLKEHVKGQLTTSTSLHGLFGTAADYEANIKRVLALRLEQVRDADLQLLTWVEKMVRDLTEPSVVLGHVRTLVNKAMLLAWRAELPSGDIPAEWSNDWSRVEQNPPRGRVDALSAGAKFKALRLMADPRRAGKTRLSRSTIFLLDFLHTVGNYGQHQGERLDEEEVSQGLAVAVSMSAIHLVEQLTRELARG